MKRLAHIVNPVMMAGKNSDLTVAQPITFESMRIAKAFAAGKVEVSLMTTQFREDREMVPADFVCTPDLERSVLDVGDFTRPRKLPLIKDILDRMYQHSDADFLIYTNVDIALMPSFYVAINQIIDMGYDAFSINRRTISDTYTKPAELPLMYAELGEPHPGNDCFVFSREAYTKYVLSDACIGAQWIGRIMVMNLHCHALKFRKFRDKHLTFHVGQDRVWKNEKFNDYSLHNRSCALDIARELQRNHGSFRQHTELAKYIKDLEPDSLNRSAISRLQRYIDRKLSRNRRN